MELTKAQQSEEGDSVNGGLPDLGPSIDAVTFEQILEMDDDEDEREFSKSVRQIPPLIPRFLTRRIDCVWLL